MRAKVSLTSDLWASGDAQTHFASFGTRSIPMHCDAGNSDAIVLVHAPRRPEPLMREEMQESA